jgi:hypothetical protein
VITARENPNKNKNQKGVITMKNTTKTIRGFRKMIAAALAVMTVGTTAVLTASADDSRSCGIYNAVKNANTQLFIAEDAGTYFCTVRAKDCTGTVNEFTFKAYRNGDVLEYTDCTQATITFGEDGFATVEEDGQLSFGRIELGNAGTLWQDSKGATVMFAKEI